MNRLLLLIILIFPHALFSQSKSRKIIKAGKIFNSLTGQFITGTSIIINGNKIESVKKEAELTQREKSYPLIDLSKYAVLPGLIDAHTHLLSKEVAGQSSSLEMVKSLVMQGDAYRALYGASKAKAYLEAGITAVQDLGNSGQFADIALQKAISEGLVNGPRMRCAGKGLAAEGGQVAGVTFPYQHLISGEYRIVNGKEDAVKAVRENVNQGADVIKIYSNNIPNKTALSIEEMRAIVNEAHRYNIRVTAHAPDNRSVYDAIISGVDGIEHGYEIADTTLALMARKGIVLVPTDGDKYTFIQWGKIAYPDDKDVEKNVVEFRKAFSERVQRAIKKGVTIVAGSDDYHDLKMPFGERSKRTLIGYYESGMPIPEILKAATINAARHLNLGNEIGVIKEGYLADLIAVDTNIDKNINLLLEVYFVMKDGQVYVNK